MIKKRSSSITPILRRKALKLNREKPESDDDEDDPNSLRYICNSACKMKYLAAIKLS